MTGFTPGPWWLTTDENGRYYVKAGPFSVADLWHPPAGTAEGNARLMRAAPDLLAALKVVLDHPLCRLDGFSEQKVRAAIAKAEGREAPEIGA